jgi:hypothetical protein
MISKRQTCEVSETSQVFLENVERPSPSNAEHWMEGNGDPVAEALEAAEADSMPHH